MVFTLIKKSGVLLICFWLITGCASSPDTPPASLAKEPSVEFPAAVTLVGPISRILLGGGSLMATGGRQLGGSGPYYGNGLNGKLDVLCEGKPGIATESPGPPNILLARTGPPHRRQQQPMEDCASGTCTQILGGKEASITGSGGKAPDMVHGQTDFTLTDAQKLRERLTQTGAPTRTWEEPVIVSQEPSFGSAESPAILHFKDKARIQGLSGTGVLIVDGDLMILGTLKWQGIVLVGVCEGCKGLLMGVGNMEVNGALVLSKDLDAYGLFNGAAEIRYSCKSIDRALKPRPAPVS